MPANGVACFVAGSGEAAGILGLSDCIGGVLEVGDSLTLLVGGGADHAHVENLWAVVGVLDSSVPDVTANLGHEATEESE